MGNAVQQTCPFCKGPAKITREASKDCTFVECDICGRVALYPSEEKIDQGKLASYLYYNGKMSQPIITKPGFFYNVIGTKERFDEEYAEHPYCYRVTSNVVYNWFPKTFNEMVDMFLLGIAARSAFLGDKTIFTVNAWCSAIFARRTNSKGEALDADSIFTQARMFHDYLKEKNYIHFDYSTEGHYIVRLLPNGWQRADELQKKDSKDSKNVFIAMSFSPEMIQTREAIKEAITECGYVPRIMDEIEHNHQIVPEMLHEIRQARFVVADLTGGNNGAYYEAGYSLGFGKEVIQLCNEDDFQKHGHFDVKQINTITWKIEDDLKEKLIKRIKATIE